MGEKKKKLNRSEVKTQLSDIIALFHKFPKIKTTTGKVNPLKKIIDTSNLQNKKEDTLQEILDYLRVCVKYMVFDGEAYKRECEYLRQLLRDKDKNG